jgi:hypothetical protein
MVDLFRYLEGQLVLISALATSKRTVVVHGRTYRTSFLRGAVSRIGRRLMEKREALVGESEGNSRALVVLGSAVDGRVAEDYPRLRKLNASASVNVRAFEDGDVAGQTLDLGDSALTAGRGQLPE